MTGDRAKANPFRFSTKYQDEESGLLYYGYRYYDAGVGRWMSRDPIEEAGGVNIYVLSSNTLADYLDFLGLFVFARDSVSSERMVVTDTTLGLSIAGKAKSDALGLYDSGSWNLLQMITQGLSFEPVIPGTWPLPSPQKQDCNCRTGKFYCECEFDNCMIDVHNLATSCMAACLLPCSGTGPLYPICQNACILTCGSVVVPAEVYCASSYAGCLAGAQ